MKLTPDQDDQGFFFGASIEILTVNLQVFFFFPFALCAGAGGIKTLELSNTSRLTNHLSQ
jgi:hypothetical protein